MTGKFNIGDTVLIKRDNKRTPLWVRQNVKLSKPRTIVGTYYDKKQKHTLYYLGSKIGSKIDLSFTTFRASQLKSCNRQVLDIIRRHKRRNVHSMRSLELLCVNSSIM